ncbi:MAG: helix-turn-helix transcriptional regulator [Rhodobacteraceae bacterium]|nr:helix-turn-helix transcriptional regulator [Paracoccaceae bacterium]
MQLRLGIAIADIRNSRCGCCDRERNLDKNSLPNLARRLADSDPEWVYNAPRGPRTKLLYKLMFKGEIDSLNSRLLKAKYSMNTKSLDSSKGSLPDTLYVNFIDSIGTESFISKIAGLIERYISFDGLIVFLYSKNSAPTTLGCFGSALEMQLGIENYLKYTYVLNPVYRAYQDNAAAGAYVISDLKPVKYIENAAKSNLIIRIDHKETIGYRTPGWPKGMTDVVGLVHLPDGKMIEFDFIVSQSGNQIENCYERLNAIYPVLSSVLLKQFEFAAQDFDTSNANPSLESRFQEFGKSKLTEREQLVVKMILTGHSSNSIGLNLGISLPTVKSHRRNIYTKLDISSQAELFNLLVQTLLEDAN